jgi:hypothetical protein
MTARQLYPHHRPSGIEPDWHHRAIPPSDAARMLRGMVSTLMGAPIEAVAWTDRRDDLRCLVADYTGGMRITLREEPRSYRVTYARWTDQ